MTALASGKTRRVLEALVAGRQLTRYDAEKLGDHCLPTTISVLHRRHGIEADRDVVKINGVFGKFWARRYWLSDAGKARARALLNGMTREVPHDPAA